MKNKLFTLSCLLILCAMFGLLLSIAFTLPPEAVALCFKVLGTGFFGMLILTPTET